MADSNQPVKTIRSGSIKVTIWANATKHGLMYNAVVRRSYKKGPEWKETDSLGEADLLVAGRLLGLAFDWITEAKAADASATASTSPADAAAA